MSDHFICGICGEEHSGHLTDQAFRLPDIVWALSEAERSERAKWNSDLCRLDGRYYLSGVLYVPFSEAAGAFGWGVWAEVDWPTFERYPQKFGEDGSNEPPHVGSLANAIPGYDETLGRRVVIRFGDARTRPSISLMPDDDSTLALEQRSGMATALPRDSRPGFTLSLNPPPRSSATGALLYFSGINQPLEGRLASFSP